MCQHMCIVHDVRFLQFSTTKLIILGENTFKPDLWGKQKKTHYLTPAQEREGSLSRAPASKQSSNSKESFIPFNLLKVYSN